MPAKPADFLRQMRAGSFGVGLNSAVSTHKKLRWQNKVLFTGTALEHLNLGRCPWNPRFTSALSRCLGRTFAYKVKDREIILSCLPFFQNNNYHLYLEIFDLFLKCADGISAHRTSVRMWSIINPSRRRAIGRRCTLGLCQAQQSLRDFAFVVVGKAPAYMAARLPVSEKDFVVDHAQSLGFNVGDPWRSHPEKGLRKC